MRLLMRASDNRPSPSPGGGFYMGRALIPRWKRVCRNVRCGSRQESEWQVRFRRNSRRPLLTCRMPSRDVPRWRLSRRSWRRDRAIPGQKSRSVLTLRPTDPECDRRIRRQASPDPRMPDGVARRPTSLPPVASFPAIYVTPMWYSLSASETDTNLSATNGEPRRPT